MITEKATICNTTRDQILNLVLKQWTKDLGWNPCFDDVDYLMKVDINGLFISFLGDTPVGFIASVKYSTNIGHIGYFIVLPEYRGKGYGAQLFEHALKYLCDRRVYLGSAMNTIPIYEKSGFRKVGWTQKYKLSVESVTEKEAMLLKIDDFLSAGTHEDMQIDSFKNLKWTEYQDYDLQVSGLPRNREAFEAFKRMEALSGVFAKDRRNGSIIGVCAVRASTDGHKIGPWYAENKYVAAALLKGTLARLQNTSVFIDVPLENETAVTMVQDLGSSKVFLVARMLKDGKGYKDLEDLSRVYCHFHTTVG